MSSEQKKSGGQSVISVVKGVLVGVITTLILVLFFSLIIKLTNLSQGLIMPFNQIIKVLAIFIGVYICLKHQNARGIIMGIIVGFFITSINYLIFSIISNEWSFSLVTIFDIILGCAMGAICGIIVANIKKDR